MTMKFTEAQLLAFVAETDRVLSQLTDVQQRFLQARDALATDSKAAPFITTVEMVTDELLTFANALTDAKGRLLGLM